VRLFDAGIIGQYCLTIQQSWGGMALRVVATDPWDLVMPAVEALGRAGIRVDVLPAGLDDRALAQAARDAEVLLVGIRQLNRQVIERLPAARLLVRCGTGFDILDVAAATERGIRIANVPDYCIDEVADHTFLLLLAAVRRVRQFALSWELDGRWEKLDYPDVHRLRGRTLGLVGFGRVASEVARRARAFELRVIAASPRLDPARLSTTGVEAVEFDDLIRRSDIISLHCPLTPSTIGLLDDVAFSRMRPGVLIVNTSRGPLIDLGALERALDAGVVAAAGLDVVEGEPEPMAARSLLDRRNVLVTPHVAWYSREALIDLGSSVADEVLRYAQGRPPRSLVNPEVMAMGALAGEGHP
jgi:D-3-phosphoglycerate dehydrogenase / 2-oxoglutarate reductase